MSSQSPHMTGWMRAFFITIGIISVTVSFVALFRPMLTIEIVLLSIPLVLPLNSASWIIEGAAGKQTTIRSPHTQRMPSTQGSDKDGLEPSIK